LAILAELAHPNIEPLLRWATVDAGTALIEGGLRQVNRRHRMPSVEQVLCVESRPSPSFDHAAIDGYSVEKHLLQCSTLVD
jgi:hypothetical protein